MSRPQLRIGTSGYQYDHWRGTFYPRRLRRDAADLRRYVEGGDRARAAARRRRS